MSERPELAEESMAERVASLQRDVVELRGAIAQLQAEVEEAKRLAVRAKIQSSQVYRIRRRLPGFKMLAEFLRSSPSLPEMSAWFVFYWLCFARVLARGGPRSDSLASARSDDHRADSVAN